MQNWWIHNFTTASDDRINSCVSLYYVIVIMSVLCVISRSRKLFSVPIPT